MSLSPSEPRHSSTPASHRKAPIDTTISNPETSMKSRLARVSGSRLLFGVFGASFDFDICLILTNYVSKARACPGAGLQQLRCRRLSVPVSDVGSFLDFRFWGLDRPTAHQIQSELSVLIRGARSKSLVLARARRTWHEVLSATDEVPSTQYPVPRVRLSGIEGIKSDLERDHRSPPAPVAYPTCGNPRGREECRSLGRSERGMRVI